MNIKNKIDHSLKFFDKANKKYKNKFDYSNFNYVDAKTKSTIVCPDHGAFEQTPDKHLSGVNPCPTCNSISKKFRKRTHQVKREPVNATEFLRRFEEKHPTHNFVLNMENYEGLTKGTVTLFCLKHGLSDYNPRSLIISSYACRYCGQESSAFSKVKSYDQLLKELSLLYRDAYEYDERNRQTFKNRGSEITIICPKHGTFKKVAQKHLSGQGCFKCKIEELVESGVLCGGYNKNLFKNNPEIANKDGWVYYIKIDSIYKIGITTNMNSRMKSLKSISNSENEIKILDSLKVNLEDAYSMKKYVLKKYEENRIRTDWSTELFSSNVLDNQSLAEIRQILKV